MACPGCATPHHADCFEENRGCTVFGCTSAPADEPKLDLSASDMAAISPQASHEPAPRTAAPPPPLVGAAPAPYRGTNSLLAAPPAAWQPVTPDPVWSDADDAKKRGTFIALGVLLGSFGAHNFYAGYKTKAIAQLSITVLTLGFGGAMSWIWAVVDICTVERDARGVLFKG
jgi:TM2 domain-containing membrane protein YozV